MEADLWMVEDGGKPVDDEGWWHGCGRWRMDALTLLAQATEVEGDGNHSIPAILNILSRAARRT